MKKIIYLLIISIILTGCNNTAQQQVFSQQATATPEPTEIVQISAVDINNILNPEETPQTEELQEEKQPEAKPESTPEPTPEPIMVPLELEEYTGPLYHVFYHFLIAFPDIAYSNSYGRDLDRDCVTPTEFRRSLEELYKNDFVLIDINKYITVNDDGTVSKAQIMVPKGKKPLVMSFDDINYYSKNHGKGICDKIILDEDGNFAMYTLMMDGTEMITYDNDVVPMLEAFCMEYPDFSPFGDKGLLALTGYDGILGYRIQRDSPNRDAEIAAVKPVVAALKEAGWQFASHSYGHIHSRSVGVNRVVSDTYNWDNEISEILGGTIIYVFPYGEYTEHSQQEFRHLIDSGFKILCGVGLNPYFKQYDNYVFVDRAFIDGNSLTNRADLLKPMMDAGYVYCPEERHK